VVGIKIYLSKMVIGSFIERMCASSTTQNNKSLFIKKCTSYYLNMKKLLTAFIMQERTS